MICSVVTLTGVNVVELRVDLAVQLSKVNRVEVIVDVFVTLIGKICDTSTVDVIVDASVVIEELVFEQSVGRGSMGTSEIIKNNEQWSGSVKRN